MSDYSPPYIFSGLYDRENAQRLRRSLEGPNKTTIHAIFERRAKEKRRLADERRAYQNHLNGIHAYGFCAWCPANVFYD